MLPAETPDPYNNLERHNILWSGDIYSFLTTLDGSPTLRIYACDAEPERVERMHHPKGAREETLEIYGRAIDVVIQNAWPYRFISVGLGLGYNEILLAFKWLRSRSPDVFILSFESLPILREQFIRWVNGHGPQTELDFAFDHAYSQIADGFAHECVDPSEIRTTLQTWLKEGRWRVESALTKASLNPPSGHERVSGILFDAYSSKTSPELWEEPFLQDFLVQYAAHTCVFTTYAALGRLKRVLKINGFHIERNPGYGGKRERTWAVRKNYSASSSP